MQTFKNYRARPGGAAGVAAIALIVIGVVLAVGGVWLVVVGGSWYYILAAVGFLASGGLLLVRSPLAIWTYAALFLGTLLWALWEAGLDWWPLAARLDVLFIMGAILLLPWVGGRSSRARSAMADAAPAVVSWRRDGRMALGVTLLLFVVIAVASWMYDPHTTKGTLPPSQGQLIAEGQPVRGVPPGEWHAYGRTGFGQRYSPLDQITPANVGKLQVAWQLRTGDMRGKPGDPVETTFEVTPLKVGNRLYLCTPHQQVLAVDATTGKVIWRHDVKVQGELALQHLTCRGVSYQPAPVTSAPGMCPGKIFMPTADGRLVALNPETGATCAEFGNNGQIDLWQGMPNHDPGAYYSTSPVVVAQNLVVVGGTVLDNVSTKEQSGVIRAFNADTGALVWNWDSGRPDATMPLPADQTYTVNSPNSWSISSVDEALGLVYVPLGNQPPDQWGGNRSPSVERYSSAVVALELATGKVRWVYQTVHHDLWDYDVPAQPSLIDLRLNGQVVPALVQPTKQGELFVLDRRTGAPLLPVHEKPAPQGAAQGDHTAPTQPKSALSFDPKPLTGRDMWGATMFDQLYCRVAFHRLRYEGRFTPPSTQGSLIYPGNFGVFNWGSVAVDPMRQIVFATPTYLAFVSKLVPRPNDTALMVQGGERPQGSLPALNENFGAPFAVKLSAFVSPFNIPCQQPPWGNVAGAELGTGRIAWMHRNGTVRDLSPLPVPFKMGVPNLGGPVMTAGGVAFLSGTLDYYVRGYNVTNGEEVWRSRLPAGGQATPMTYTGADGRQYVVVVAGGHGSLGTKAGDYVIAYALPKNGS
jgi:quinoprotein glucose dehydrogenase